MARPGAQARLGLLLRREQEVFPESVSGTPWLPPRRGPGGTSRTGPPTPSTSPPSTTRKPPSARCATRSDASRTSSGSTAAWLSALKLHAATLPLAEFAAVVGNLRAARFGRDSAWRTMATFGALDELRHTQIPLLLMHELVALGRAVRLDAQASSTPTTGSRSPARHLVDELLLGVQPDRVRDRHQLRVRDRLHQPAVHRPRVARARVGDRMFEKMVHEHPDRRGAPRADRPAGARDGRSSTIRAYAQYLVDKWFWRSWLFFAVVTGFAMDYLTPLEHRTPSFKEFMEEWVLDQFAAHARRARARSSPGTGTRSSSRSTTTTTWSTRARTPTARRSGSTSCCPAPTSAPGCARSIRARWDAFEPIWERITERWRRGGPGRRVVRPRRHAGRLLRPVPARALRRHARAQHRADAGARRAASTSSAPSPALDLRARARALRGAQGRRQAHPRRRSAGQPHRAPAGTSG